MWFLVIIFDVRYQCVSKEFLFTKPKFFLGRWQLIIKQLILRNISLQVVSCPTSSIWTFSYQISIISFYVLCFGCGLFIFIRPKTILYIIIISRHWHILFGLHTYWNKLLNYLICICIHSPCKSISRFYSFYISWAWIYFSRLYDKNAIQIKIWNKVNKKIKMVFRLRFLISRQSWRR